MRDFQEIKQEIEADEAFQKWKKSCPDAYLVHFFCMNEAEVHVGYYDVSKDIIVTFVKVEKITKTEDKEIFKQGEKIVRLDMGAVKRTVSEAIEKAEAVQKKKYPADCITKQIIVLQTIEKKPVYNITFITMTFKMINIHVNAETGDVIHEKMQPIMDFVQTIEKGNRNEKGEQQ